MKVFLIARVSTEDQNDALPAQIYNLQAYAKRRGYENPKLVQITESAYKPDRTIFRQFLDSLSDVEELIILIFDKIDRYTRDTSSSEVTFVNKLWRKGKAELHFASDNLEIRKGSPANDIMRLGMGGVVSQYYSDAISDNVKRRLQQKLRDGEIIGAAPFGYKNVTLPDGKKWVEIDPLKAEAVRQVFQWYATGNYSMKLMRQKLKAEFAFELPKSSVENIVKNPFYSGKMLVKGELYPHKYDTVVALELYKQAEAVRLGYKVKFQRWAGLPYAYRSLITCSVCGCKITFEKKKNKYVYGHCTQFKGKHGAPYVNEDDMTKQLMEVFRSIQVPEQAFKEVSEGIRAAHEDKKRLRAKTIALLDGETEKYQRRMDKLYEDYLDEKVPEAFYARKFTEYREAQKTIQNKRINVDLVEDDYYRTVTHLLEVAKKAPVLFEQANIEQKRALLNLTLSNLELVGKELRWKLKKPFDSMAFCSENGNWLTTIEEVITAIKQDLRGYVIA